MKSCMKVVCSYDAIQYGCIIEVTISYYPNYVMAEKCGKEKMVYSIIKPYRIADPMIYRILD